MDDRLGAIADARGIAAGTMRMIRSNFTAAVGINSGLLGAAMLGRLSPVASALLHNGTTIAILLRALKGVSVPERTPHQFPLLAHADARDGCQDLEIPT